MFSAKTANSTEWKAIAAAVKTLVEEATFEGNSEGLSFRAMDPSHVALVDLSWPRKSFESYQCDKPYRFSLRVEDLVKLVGRAETKDSLEISSTDEQAIMLRLSNGYDREFTIHLIESAGGSAPLPKIEFGTKAIVTKTILEKILGDVATVADQITMEASVDKLTFSGRSDVGKAEISLTKSDQDILELQSSATDKATYSVDFLSSISKALGSVADKVQIEFSTKKPVRLTFDLDSQGGRLQYLLAPRILE